MDEVITVRPFAEPDLPFVLDSWVASFRKANISGVLPWLEYQRAHRNLFARVIRDRAKVLVAVHPEDEEYIFGYLVTEEWRFPIVHWAYVKSAEDRSISYRRKGILNRLLYEAGIDPTRQVVIVTCWTRHVSYISKHRREHGVTWQLKHDPEFLRDPHHKEMIDERTRRTHVRHGGPARSTAPSGRGQTDVEPQHEEGAPGQGPWADVHMG